MATRAGFLKNVSDYPQVNNFLSLGVNQLNHSNLCPFPITFLGTLNGILRVLLLNIPLYSYFEKGCRKKCTRQSRKALWVVLSLLFFKDFERIGTKGHGNVFASAKGKQQK